LIGSVYGGFGKSGIKEGVVDSVKRGVDLIVYNYIGV
jgi:hypothetical protein